MWQAAGARLGSLKHANIGCSCSRGATGSESAVKSAEFASAWNHGSVPPCRLIGLWQTLLLQALND